MVSARQLVSACMVLGSASVHAFPTFARKYETGCQTCHVAVPKLNSFGIAFRNSGYQWPGGEAEMTRDKPVVLAADANKEAFPQTIWPSWLPRTPPIAILVVGEIDGSPSRRAFFGAEGLGVNVEVGLGGAILEDVAVRADLTFVANGAGKVDVGIEQAFFQFHNLEGHQHLDLRVGKLWPELFSFPAQALGGDYWLYDRQLGSNPWTLAGRPGLELRGTLLSGRLRAVLGTAGSSGAFAQSWDVWARVGYKLGGLRYDGVEEGAAEPATSADASRPWRDNSVQFGVFAYKGFAAAQPELDALGVLAPPLRDDFLHAGADLSVWLGDANLIAAVLVGHHARLAAGVAPSFFRQASVQLDYVVFPWLIPSVRFEVSDEARLLEYSEEAPLWHLVSMVNVLIRANLKAYALAEVIPSADQHLSFHKLTLGVLAAF